MHVDVFKQISIRGIYGSSLTDLTNYLFIYYSLYREFGMINILCSKKPCKLSEAIKTFKKNGGFFCFMIMITNFEGCHHQNRRDTYFQSYANLSLEGQNSLSLKKVINLWNNRSRVQKNVSLDIAKFAIRI